MNMGVSLARVGWLCVFKSSCEMLLVAVAAVLLLVLLSVAQDVALWLLVFFI